MHTKNRVPVKKAFRPALLIAAGLSLWLGAAPARPALAANSNDAIVGREPWPGQRTIMVLPMQLGEGWNADRTSGQLLLRPAQEALVRILQSTGKFSVITPHRFNPVLMRAVQDKLITKAELLELEANPGIGPASQLLSKITFGQVPLVTLFTLEEVRASNVKNRGVVQMQVLGRLYDINNPVALKTVAVTSDAVQTRGKQTILDTAALAAANAFAIAVPQFIEPLPDISFAAVAPTTPPSTGGMAPPAGTVPIVPPDNGVPPSAMEEPPLRGSSSDIPPVSIPKLPPPSPPLGIGVPGATTVGR